MLPGISVQYSSLRIVGDLPLICHAWNGKTKKLMVEEQQEKTIKGKEPRRPVIEFADCLYWVTEKPNLDGLTDEEAQEKLSKVIPQSKFGFPATAFKSAAIDGGVSQGIIEKSDTVQQTFYVMGDLAEIEGTPPTIYESVTRGKNGNAQITYRAKFETWATNLNIRYNANVISVRQIINLFNAGGFGNGVGDYRIGEKGGKYGAFHVEC